MKNKRKHIKLLEELLYFYLCCSNEMLGLEQKARTIFPYNKLVSALAELKGDSFGNVEKEVRDKVPPDIDVHPFAQWIDPANEG